MFIPSRHLAGVALAGVENDVWPSTGALDVETNSLDLSIQQLAHDNFDQGMLGWDSVLQNAWNTFIADWNQWKSAGWFWNPSRRDELLSYRKRFNDLLAQIQARGTSTQTQPVAAVGVTPFDQVSSMLTKTAWIVGGVAAIWAASTVYKEVRRR